MIESNCKQCGIKIVRRGKRKAVFCSLNCKAEWQREQKPITKNQLFDLYVTNGMGTYQIAKLVNRDPKRVYSWLKDWDIPIRKRQWEAVSGNQPYHKKEWLSRAYVNEKRAAIDIANQFNVSENNILFFLHKFGIKTRRMDEIRMIKYWGQSGPENPMYGKNGKANPNWRGGFTPERQSFYSSEIWKNTAQKIWKRDKATCQRCFLKADGVVQMHIHHIISFAVKKYRVEESNLVLFCKPCHNFIHSLENEEKAFIGEEANV